jgi:hypothetical protein
MRNIHIGILCNNSTASTKKVKYAGIPIIQIYLSTYKSHYAPEYVKTTIFFISFANQIFLHRITILHLLKFTIQNIKVIMCIYISTMHKLYNIRPCFTTSRCYYMIKKFCILRHWDLKAVSIVYYKIVYIYMCININIECILTVLPYEVKVTESMNMEVILILWLFTRMRDLWHKSC